MGNSSNTAQKVAPSQVDNENKETKKLKPCCACPETKRQYMRKMLWNRKRLEHYMGSEERTTESLNSLVSKMNEQLQRSEDTTSTLIHSSAVLHETHNQFNAVGATIRVSGKMISKYARRETTDKFLISLALLLYFGVILCVLKKRIFLF
uniref:Sec20 C-terminal domain-containing protein n=1 Tax=Acrobeloides nanus TaxID=290746 RepID=A0A914D1R4_9BILA